MRKLSDTIGRLSALRNLPKTPTAPGADRLADLADFGSNPGALRARIFIPADLPAGAPLVVVLHGCTQTAAAYDHGAGWSVLAERAGFAVLLPEQQRANNANLCFNWFVPGDIRRGSGEALSIRQMIEAVASRHAIDRGRIFVTGLSAGGAMANVMLATYPEVFAGGAIIAGLPYGVASTVPEAFDLMRGHNMPSPSRMQSLLQKASVHRGRWPRVSIWQGAVDQTVASTNATAIRQQWSAVHSLPPSPHHTERVDGHERRVWRDRDGREALELHSIAGMGHGTPLSTSGVDALGHAGPFLLEAGISSTMRIAQFWGIAAPTSAAAPGETRETSEVEIGANPMLIPPKPEPHPAHEASSRQTGNASSRKPKPTGDVQRVIEDALRSAGLLR